MADGELEHNPLTLSDAQILDQVFKTHDDADSECDVDSLFSLVQSILKPSTHLVDNVLRGSQGSLENYDAKSPQASFNPPLRTLKQISFEMSSKPPVMEIAHKTTLAILHKLSNYSWQAKAVFTLAALTLDYGDFYMLSQYQSIDPVAKSLAILKKVPMLTSPAAIQKYQQDIIELNNLIKACLQVIEMIFELENLSSYYDIEDVPTLSLALDQIPVDVYWTIIISVVCVTQIDCLTIESEERLDLSHFGQKTNVVLSKLKETVFGCRDEIGAVKYYKITDVLKVLYLWKDAPENPIHDGATRTLVSIDVLEGKFPEFLFISNLDITEEEIDILTPLHEHIESESDATMVWIPMVEEWTEPVKERFEILKSKMPWFVVQYFGTAKGIKFIKEKWHFEKEPMLVSNDKYDEIKRTISLQGLQHNGWQDFYFASILCRFSGAPKHLPDDSNAQMLSKEAEGCFGITVMPAHLPGDSYVQMPSKEAGSWVVPLVKEIDPEMSTLGKYIFIYGGNNRKWLGEFRKHVTALQQDPILEEANVSIKLFCIERYKNFQSCFWSRLERLFKEGIQEVEKMLSYKNETSWALLSDGSTVILEGHGTTILKTVKEFEKWKEDVIRKGFEISFKEQHGKVAENSHH